MLLDAAIFYKCFISFKIYLSIFQGMFIFLFFVLMNSEVRSSLKRYREASSYFTSVSKLEKDNFKYKKLQWKF